MINLTVIVQKIRREKQKIILKNYNTIMATLNDYREWLSVVWVEEPNYDDIHSLVYSLGKKERYGSFNTQIAKGDRNGWIISADGVDDVLHLFTDSQITEFIKHIEDTFCDGMDVGAYRSYRRAMGKDD